MTVSRAQGWRRLFANNRGVWLLALIAVITTVTATVLAGVVIAAEDTGAEDQLVGPGLITVPVERRVIANEITTRGDAVYAGAVNLTIDVAGLQGPPVVTGHVPAVGSTIKAGAVALEVAGRPVIVLPGRIPAYRTMRVGTSGPDVRQLKAALARLGIDPGDKSSPMFDAAAATAVSRLYTRIGYEPPRGEEEPADRVRTAEDAVRQSDLTVTVAERALRTAKAGATPSERADQDARVRAAQRELTAAKASGTRAEVAAAKDALKVAELVRAEALAVPDLRVELATLKDARASAASARHALAGAKQDALPALPAGEVAFLDKLPRRVDKVEAIRGRPLTGAAMSLSGATLAVRATVGGADADRVKAGAKATVTMPDKKKVSATVLTVGPGGESVADQTTADDAGDSQDEQGGESTDGASTATVTVVTLAPNGTPKQLAALAGHNVKIVIPVETTSGEVLAIPVAALTAGTGGQSRVEVPTGTDGRTRLVEVRTGLAAGGFVEITSGDGALDEGDQVVVGR